MAHDDASFDTIFCGAIEVASAEERAVFIAQACGPDEELRCRVERLVDAHFQAGSFLESPPASPTMSTTLASSSEGPGMVIGNYKLLQPIGEGGMGTVYMAEQSVPVRRVVALKLIKAGMDSRQVLARFGAERQALALMDHPNIAKVFDAGTTEQGRPYFVMELVKGVPITRFCDERRLTTRERLELAIPVCQAVQHAHQKGIIHRDLKPSNVLIALYDDKPVPKVIDFGVAKATGPRLTDQTLYTEFGAVVGTLEYMSPEQAQLNQLDIDTRSDIYSLGVLLYELLTGSTPLDRKRLKQGALLEMLRVIREEESPRPSMRLSTTEELPSIAACRSIEPRKLSGLVRGELDWIVMKALEKDRNRRYETANGLAADLRRFLDDEPVQACPPSAWYRSGKFARRNKGVLTAAGLISVALVATVGFLAISNALISREKDQKETALHQARDNAKVAVDQRGIADRQRGIALKNEQAAKLQERLARSRFYAAQMNLAQQAWETDNPARVLELLEGQRPRFDEEDLRNFEWYYLWGLCHVGHRLTLHGYGGFVTCVAFSPDGKTLASGHWNMTVKLWDVATGREEASLMGHLKAITCLAFSPDGKTLATGDYGKSVKLWDVATGQEQGVLEHPAWVRSMAFSPDGKTLAVGSEMGQGTEKTGVVKLWDVGTRQERGTLRGHKEAVLAVAFTADGKTLASASSWGEDGGIVKLWDLATWKARLMIPVSTYALAFSPDSKTLAAGATNGLKLYDAATGEERAKLQGHSDWVASVTFSPDGKTLASGSTDRSVKLWDLATGQQRTRQVHLGPVNCLAFSPDGKTLVSGSNEGTVRVSDVAPIPVLTVLQQGDSVGCVAFNPDGKTVISGGETRTTLWDVATGQSMDPFPAPSGPLALSPDGKTLAVSGQGKSVLLWDVDTRRERAILQGQTEAVGVAYSGDGKTLATWRPGRIRP